jgi:ankyrin repeat protein
MIIIELKQIGASINAQLDENQDTPLHQAISKLSADAVLFLIQKGAKLEHPISTN